MTFLLEEEIGSFSLKFDCEKLAQEKLEVHRQYVMVNIRRDRITDDDEFSFRCSTTKCPMD